MSSVLAVLDVTQSRGALADELGYQKSTVSKALGTLERSDLIYRERNGNQTLARPVENRCVEALQSLTKRHPHVDFPELLTQSMVNVLYYLSSHESWTAAELTERTGHARATIYRNVRTLRNRAMVRQTDRRYQLADEFADLHVFAHELRHHLHRVQIKRDLGTGTIVWESHEEFLVQTETTVDGSDYHRTGLDAYTEYGLEFFTKSELYYYYAEERNSLSAADLVCHLLLIENDTRHRKYALLLVVVADLSLEEVESTANRYGMREDIVPLLEFLDSRGGATSAETPQWDEFQRLADDYEVSL